MSNWAVAGSNPERSIRVVSSQSTGCSNDGGARVVEAPPSIPAAAGLGDRATQGGALHAAGGPPYKAAAADPPVKAAAAEVLLEIFLSFSPHFGAGLGAHVLHDVSDVFRGKLRASLLPQQWPSRKNKEGMHHLNRLLEPPVL